MTCVQPPPLSLSLATSDGTRIWLQSLLVSRLWAADWNELIASATAADSPLKLVADLVGTVPQPLSTASASAAGRSAAIGERRPRSIGPRSLLPTIAAHGRGSPSGARPARRGGHQLPALPAARRVAGADGAREAGGFRRPGVLGPAAAGFRRSRRAGP